MIVNTIETLNGRQREKGINDLLHWIETEHQFHIENPDWDGDLWNCDLLQELSKWGLPYNNFTPYAELKQFVKELK